MNKSSLQLKILLHEADTIHGTYAYEWILSEGLKIGIKGATVFRSLESYGEHGQVHTSHFFELESNTSVMIIMIGPASLIRELLDHIKKEKIRFHFTLTEVEFGHHNP